MSEDLNDKADASLEKGIDEFKQGKVEDCPEKYREYPGKEIDALKTPGVLMPFPKVKEQPSIWKTIETIDSGTAMKTTLATDVIGGVIVQTILVLGENVSQSMVFLPGFEMLPNGKIRKQ